MEVPCTTVAAYNCALTDTVVGVVYGYEDTVYTNDDYIYISTIGKASPANDYTQKIIMSANSNAQKGKMRQTFGKYLVMNKNLNEIEIWGYQTPANLKLTLIWTSTVEPSIEYMGAHQFYWWPYNQFLMARLSDGSSFKFFRFAKNFETIAPQAENVVADADKIQGNGYNLFHVNGRVTIPPVFHE